jgi:hypothetical protein
MYAPPAPSQLGRQDLSALNTARELYQTYLRIHAHKAQQPLGVVLHRISFRGKLLFRDAPVLLPEEYFFSFQQLQGNQLPGAK